MLTNDIKKGMRIKLRNGFDATMQDNKKGNIRLAEVDGYFGKELGSVYSHDIVAVLVDEKWVHVEHTKDQQKTKAVVDASFRW